MKLWIVVNRYLRTEKFLLLERRLTKAADELNIEYEVVTNADCMPVVCDSAVNTGVIPCNDDPVLFWDKDIHLARALECSGHRLYNCSEAIEICDDKRLTAISLAGLGIMIPKTIIAPMTYNNIPYSDCEFLDKVADELGFPVILKEAFGSFGMGVYLCRDKDELYSIFNSCSGSNILFQEYIDTSAGKDIRLQVTGGRVLSSIYRYSQNGDYRANLTNGGFMKPYKPDRSEEQLAIEVCKRLKLDFAGVDILFGKEGPVLCEVNSNAHFVNLDDCTGSDTAKAIMQYIIQMTSGSIGGR